ARNPSQRNAKGGGKKKRKEEAKDTTPAEDERSESGVKGGGPTCPWLMTSLRGPIAVCSFFAIVASRVATVPCTSDYFEYVRPDAPCKAEGDACSTAFGEARCASYAGVLDCYRCMKDSDETFEKLAYGNTCPVGPAACNGCNASHYACAARDDCAVTGGSCSTHSITGSGSLVFNSLVGGAQPIRVLKAGVAVFGVLIGGVPSDLTAEQSTKTWMCRSEADTMYEVCELEPCGPFGVSVLADAATEVIEVTVCHDSLPCDCGPNGACDFSPTGALVCRCESNAEKGFWSPASKCTECLPGYFPQVGTPSATACSLTCLNGGTIQAGNDACFCVGQYQGTQCEICPPGVVGRNCNETETPLVFSFEREFTLDEKWYTPPPWKVHANSKASIRLSVNTQGIKLTDDVLESFRVIARTEEPFKQAEDRVSDARPSREVDAAYYGPRPAEVSSFRSEKYLHLFSQDRVYVYSLNTTSGSFVLVNDETVASYYKILSIDRCSQMFGDEYDRDYDSVLFVQDPATRKPNFASSLDSVASGHTTKDVLFFVKKDKTCWVAGDPAYGIPWTVSTLSIYTGWDHIEGMLMSTSDGSYWQNFEGLEFMKVFNDPSLADTFRKPNALRADYDLSRAGCYDVTGRSAEQLRSDCLIAGEFASSWDAISSRGDQVYLVKDNTVRFFNATALRCCNGSEYDEEPSDFCTDACETRHDSGVRFYGTLRWVQTEIPWPGECVEDDGFSQCVEATKVFNAHVQSATFEEYFGFPVQGRVTAVANGTFVSGTSTSKSAGPAAASSDAEQRLGEVEWTAFAETLPSLVFTEHMVHIVYPDGSRAEKRIGSAFEKMGFPRALAWKSPGEPTEQFVDTSGSSLAFHLVLEDDEGNVLDGVTELVHATLLQCGEFLTAEADACVATLEPWVDPAALGGIVRDPNSCTANVTTEAVISGSAAGGVFAGEYGVFSFTNVGISRAGVYRVLFTHRATGLSLTSPLVVVEDSPCGGGEWSDQKNDLCFVDCAGSVAADMLSADCEVVLDPNKDVIEVEISIQAFASVTISASLTQPCCHGNGLCCVGNEDCAATTTKQGIDLTSTSCLCFNSEEQGLYDVRTDCAECIDGYSLLERCQPGSYEYPVRTTSYASPDPLPAGQSNFFVTDTQPETHFVTTVFNTDADGDLDLSVAFAACPGQEAFPEKKPAAGEISAVCSGRGSCYFDEASGRAQCRCEVGVFGEACAEQCCSGNGACDQGSGGACQCVGHYAAQPRSINVSFADVSVAIHSPGDSSAHHLNAILNTTAPSFRAYISFRGLSVPSKDAISYAALTLTEAPSLTNCNPALTRVHVYATQPAGFNPTVGATALCAGLSEDQCNAAGCCSFESNVQSPSCLVRIPSSPCIGLCNVVQPGSSEPSTGCVKDASFISDQDSPFFGQCRCDAGYTCSWGSCVDTESDVVCGVESQACASHGLIQDGSKCACPTSLARNDALAELTCESAVCMRPVSALRYTWQGSDVTGLNYLDIDELRIAPDTSGVRFYDEVASFTMEPGTPGKTHTVDILPWLTDRTAHLDDQVYDLMDLSFAIVAEPSGAGQCSPSFWSAIPPNADARPSLKIQSRGNHQIGRLFFALENSFKSLFQSGHPYYTMYTADSASAIAELHEDGTSKNVRAIQRYTSDAMKRSLLDCEENLPSSSQCSCGMTDAQIATAASSDGPARLSEALALLNEHSEAYDFHHEQHVELEQEAEQLEKDACCSGSSDQDEIDEAHRRVNESSIELLRLQEVRDEAQQVYSKVQSLVAKYTDYFKQPLEETEGFCPCPADAGFQDPADYTQVGEWMYFLAQTDWESSPDAMPECTAATDSFPSNLFQGSREIFFTKGMPGSNIGTPGARDFQAGVDEADTIKTKSASDARFGSSAYPKISGVQHGKWSASSSIRTNVFNMRVYTRAKELTKMQNKRCVVSGCPGVAGEVLLFAAVEGGGFAPGVLDSEPDEDRRGPQLWTAEVSLATGKPRAPVLVSDEIAHPSYTTVVTPARALFLAAALNDSDPLSPSKEDVFDQTTEAPSSAKVKFPVQYHIPSTLHVYVTDGVTTHRLSEGNPRNAGVCTHPQGHPGFVSFKGKVYYYFEPEKGSLSLFEADVTDLSSGAPRGNPITLGFSEGTQTVTLVPHIPPLNRGYFQPRVIRNAAGEDLLLLLSLGDPRQPASFEDICLAAPYCDETAEAANVHQYQKTFRCMDPARGDTDLYWWDGSREVADENVHIGRVDGSGATDGFPSDPSWTVLGEKPSQVYWVKHANGMSSRGWAASRGAAGVAQRDHQLLMLSEYDEGLRQWTTVPAWSANDAVNIYDLTLWKGSVYFWAYRDLASNPQSCFPPGAELLHADQSSQSSVFRKLVAGINIPAYAGCFRWLVRTTGEPDTVEFMKSGTDADGAGVPNRQCCEDAHDGAPIVVQNRSIPIPVVRQIPGCLTCTLQREHWGWDHDKFCCNGMPPAGGPNCSSRCSDSAYSWDVVGQRTTTDFVYPRFTSPEHAKYSSTQQWSKPANGWWFAGFQQIWTDSRLSRAGVPIWNVGSALVDMGGKGNDLRLPKQQGGAFAGAVGYEFYRPGGFAWREHWPKVIGVWTEQTDELKDDCDDCEAGWYGPTCSSQCPVYQGKVCSGFPCSDGLFGDGTCKCGGLKGGLKCETDPTDTAVVIPATADTLIRDFAECDPTGDTSRCSFVNGSQPGYFTGEPTDATCGRSSGCMVDGEEAPCCGASPAPSILVDGSVMVMTWQNLPSMLRGSLVGASLLLEEHSSGDGQATCTPSTLSVIALNNQWFRFPEVGSLGVEALADLWGARVDIVTVVQQAAPVDGFVVGIDLTSWVEDSVDNAAWSGSISLALRSNCTGNECCAPYFKSREFSESWSSTCTTSVGCPGVQVTRSLSGPKLTITTRPTESCATFQCPTTATLQPDVVCQPTCTTSDCCTSGQILGNRRRPVALSRSSTARQHSSTDARIRFDTRRTDPSPRQSKPLAVATSQYPPSQLAQVVQPTTLSPAAQRTQFVKSVCSASEANDPTLPIVCNAVVPSTSAFAVVRVLAFDKSINYSIVIQHVPRGHFDSNNRLGQCIRSNTEGYWSGADCRQCLFRWTGDQCTSYVPSVCDDSTCDPEHGTCTPDPSTGNLKKKCECYSTPSNDGYTRHGTDCTVLCNPAVTCSGHGSCAEDGSCECDEDWAKRADCSACTGGKWGLSCLAACSCKSPAGTCDDQTGMCTTDASGNPICNVINGAHFAGENCDACAADYYPVSKCAVYCLPSQTCGGHGTCTDEGTCQCDAGYYGGACQTYCDDAVTCHGHGTCTATAEAPFVLCSCEARWGNSYVGGWTMDRHTPVPVSPTAIIEHCAACTDAFWGPTCSEECRCSLKGRCDPLGVCICFQDPAVGFYTGPFCRLCAIGYSRVASTGLCTEREAYRGDPGIGRNADFYSTEEIRKVRVPSASALKRTPGAMFHTMEVPMRYRMNGQDAEATAWETNLTARVETMREELTFEFIFASAGYVGTGASDELRVEVWTQKYTPRILDWRYVKSFPLFITRGGKARGRAVLGMFQDGAYMHYVAYDTDYSFIARTPPDPSKIAHTTALTSSVVLLPTANPEVRAEVLDWGHVAALHVCFTLVKVTDPAGVASYYITEHALSALDLNITSSFLIGSLSSVDSMYVTTNGGAPVAFLFGTSLRQRTTMQKVFLPQGANRGYQSVADVIPAACYVIDCSFVERLQQYNDTHSVLFIRTTVLGVENYAFQPIDMANIKHQSIDDVVLLPITHGIAGGVYDPYAGVAFVAFGSGSGVVPSSIQKVMVSELTGAVGINLTKSLGFGHTTAEVEAVAAVAADVDRRVLFAVCALTKTVVATFNMYDVFTISPDVVDAPIAIGTTVTVQGGGFTDLHGLYEPLCRMGEQRSRGTFISESVIQCSSEVPDTYSSCEPLSLEVSVTGGEDRFTETTVEVRRIGTPAVFDAIDPNSNKTTILPKPGPIDASLSIDARHRDLQLVSAAPFNSPALVDIIIPGAGFLDTDYIACLVLNTTHPATYSGTTVVCHVTPPAQPTQTVIELTLDGQIFSSDGREFYFVGPPVTLQGFFVCVGTRRVGDDVFDCASTVAEEHLAKVEPDSDGLVTLPKLYFRLLDEAGSFLGALADGALDGTVQLGTSKAPPAADNPLQCAEIVGPFPFTAATALSAQPSAGGVVFESIQGAAPAIGCYAVFAVYQPASGPPVVSNTVLIKILPGSPKTVGFRVAPSAFSNNRNVLSRQPVIAVLDGAGNSVGLSTLQVVAELKYDTLPAPLVNADTLLPEIRVDGALATATAAGDYRFGLLSVKANGSVHGRDLSHQAVGFGQLVPLTFDLEFKITCVGAACSENGGELQNIVDSMPALTANMHISDCSAGYVGSSKLAWIEPEEQPVGSQTPVTIKGWEFQQPGDGEGVYKCVYRDAKEGTWLATADAVFFDSCTLVCDGASAGLPQAPRMTSIQPAFCCQTPDGAEECPTATDEEKNCFTDGVYHWFNESSYNVVYFHRSVGEKKKLGLWNVRAPLLGGAPQPAVAAYQNALAVQTSYSAAKPDVSQSLGVRLQRSGDFIANQRNRSDFDYQLLMYSADMLHQNSVLRAAEQTAISAKRVWTPPEKEWRHQGTVATFESINLDARMAVGLLDDSVGLLNWQGNWIAGMETISLHENGKDTQVPDARVKVTVRPVKTLGVLSGGITRQVASIKGGLSQPTFDVSLSIVAPTTTTPSYFIYDEISMRYPAKGEYRLTVQVSGLQDLERTITILEGLPHRAVFDSPEWAPDGVDGLPLATTVVNRPLTTQPRFRLLDVADNTVTDLPSRNTIRVRTTASPPPLCGGGSGVVCAWDTPPLSNTTATADLLRSAHDPAFSSLGVAAYTDMNIVTASEAIVTTLTFTLYGSVLTQFGYEVPPVQAVVSTIKCAAGCSSPVCEFEPSSRSLVLESPPVQRIYGDFFDFAQLVSRGDVSVVERLRVAIKYPISLTAAEECELQAWLANACAVEFNWPTCEYQCLNVYPPLSADPANGFSDADRQSCCETNTRLDGTGCFPASSDFPGATFGRKGAVLESRSGERHFGALQGGAGALLSPSKASVAVDTQGGKANFLNRNFVPFAVKGAPVQLGAREDQLVGDFAFVVASDGAGLQSEVTPGSVLITSKDLAGNDILADDSATRWITMTVERTNDGATWIELTASQVRFDTPSATRQAPVLSLDTPLSHTAVMTAGLANFTFTLLAPVAGVYGVKVRDDTPAHLNVPSLSPCGDTCSKLNGHAVKVRVMPGKPYRLAWGEEAIVRAVSNQEPQQVAYSIFVQDYAGNSLTKTDVVDQANTVIPIHLQYTTSVPELNDAALLAKRGFTPADINSLTAQACSFVPTTNHANRDVATLDEKVTFTLSQFKIWNGMSCVLSFSPFTQANFSSPEYQTASAIVVRNLNVTVRPFSCCPSSTSCTLFGYSFEFGCWNHHLNEPVPGVPPSLTSVHRQLDCLTECGTCGEGTLCPGDTEVHAAPDYWREPVSYIAWECKRDNCVGGELGGGVALTVEQERAQADVQCKQGTHGTFCGECDEGYGRSQGTCLECPNEAQNYVLISLIGIGILVVVVVLVAINLNTGPTIAESGRVSVMVKMLMNHLQVAGLTGALIVRNNNLFKDLTTAQAQGSGPGMNLISIGCAVPSADYYDLFMAWMLMPVVIVVAPAIVLLLLQLRRQIIGKKQRKEVHCVPAVRECQSLYHWLYDWVVDPKDHAELLSAIERHSARRVKEENEPVKGDDSSDETVFLHTDEVPTISFAESTFVHLQSFRKVRTQVMDKIVGTSSGAVECTKADYGCGLCMRCCILESLFPNPGIGSVGRTRFKCTIDEHRPTDKHLRNLFRGNLLEACLARMKLQREIQRFHGHGLKDLNFKELGPRERRIFLQLFPPLQEGGSKKDRTEAEKAKPNEKMVRFALSAHPPWPVDGHRPTLQESLPGRDGKLMLHRRESAEVAIFGKGVTKSFTTEEEDTLTCEKVSGATSLWRVVRTDAVTGQRTERFTHTDPLTPPASPTAKPDDQLLLKNRGNEADKDATSTDQELPAWLFELEGIDEAPPKSDAADNMLVPMQVSEDGAHIVHSAKDVAEQLTYQQLYRMARHRRLRDKWAEWRRYMTPDEIKEKLTKSKRATASEPVFEAASESAPTEEGANVSDNDDSSSISLIEGKPKALSDEFVSTLALHDKHMVVIETCDLCCKEFAVLFDPHLDKYYCEMCDRLVHMHSSRKYHTRIRLQPKTSPLAVHGIDVRIDVWTIWKVSIIVILFLIYPSLTKEIALLLDCSEPVCVDHLTCHRFLKADPRIDCDESPYAVYMALAVLFFFVYGFGIPLVGYFLLRIRRKQLHTKQVLGTLGFLYSGFRRRRYYWEMVIMIRKMVLVFTVVFLDDTQRYQLYTAIWTMFFFTLLNIFLRPFKFKVLWSLENFSLIAITISLNIGLVQYEEPSNGIDYALTVVLVILNLAVIALFVKHIASEAHYELVQKVDDDGDGVVTCNEVQGFVRTWWKEYKPDWLRSRREVERIAERKAAKTDDQRFPNRQQRWMWLRDESEKGEFRTLSVQKRLLDERELNEWWPIAFGETASESNLNDAPDVNGASIYTNPMAPNGRSAAEDLAATRDLSPR
ncbi:Teneurin-m, partial [Diplonema papillatum]